MSYVLAYSDQTSGAECIAPVIRVLKNCGVEVLVLAKGLAKRVFEKHKLDFIEINHIVEYLPKILDGNGNPSLVLTSSTSIPSEDTSENEIRKWARESQIPSIAVLDQWHNYARRFTDTSGNLHLPDVLVVPDKLAKEEAIEDGIPSEIIEITGQPYLENIASKKLGANIRQKYDIGKDSKLIIFASECVRRVYGDARGFDECSILKALVEALLEINDSDIVLGIKLHPRNQVEDFAPIKPFLDDASKRLKIIFLGNDDGHDTILSADIITGMTSIYLAEAMLLGKPTVSIQIGSVEGDKFIGTKMGAIPLVDTKERLFDVLHKLLYDKYFLDKYIAAQKQFSYNQKNAAENIANLCIKLMKV